MHFTYRAGHRFALRPPSAGATVAGLFVTGLAELSAPSAGATACCVTPPWDGGLEQFCQFEMPAADLYDLRAGVRLGIQSKFVLYFAQPLLCRLLYWHLRHNAHVIFVIYSCDRHH